MDCIVLNSPVQNTGVGSLFLLQQIFLTQELNQGLSPALQLSHKGSPRILEWVAFPFASRSSQPRNQTRVSCIAGGFFTSLATMEALVITFTALNPYHEPSWETRKQPGRTGHGTTDCFQIGKGLHKDCILSPCLFNLYAEYIMRNAGLISSLCSGHRPSSELWASYLIVEFQSGGSWPMKV